MKKIYIVFLLFIISCKVVTHENAELYWASFSYMDAKTYYGYLSEELKENSQKIMTKYEFLRFREKGHSLEEFKNYRDFCINKGQTDCLSYNKNSISFVSPEHYLEHQQYFDQLTKEEMDQCRVKYYELKEYKEQLSKELDKKVELENKIRTEKINKNIQNLERFIENEYLKSFHEKIVVSLKSNFGFNTFVPKQWDFNGHYIRVTTDGYNINVIKNDKLIFSSNADNYKLLDFNNSANIYMEGKKKIEIYKKNNIPNDLQEKCKFYIKL